MSPLAGPLLLAPAVVGATLALQALPVLPAPGRLALVAGLAATLGLVAAWAARRSPAWGTVLLVAALACGTWAGAGHRAAERLGERLPAALEGVTLALVGVVDELPTAIEHGVRFAFAVESCEVSEFPHDPPPEPAPAGPCLSGARVSLGWHAGFRPPRRAPVPALRPGQRWALEVRLKRPHAAVNPGAFDRELRWLEEGIAAVGTVRGGRLLEERAGGLRWAIERARLSIRDGVFDAAGAARAREAGVLAALAIGDQAAIDPRLWTVFNQTGVSHLMSISGLHITMLAGLGGTLAGRLWRSTPAVRFGSCCRLPAQQLRLAAAVSVAFGYSMLAGWGVPAQRTCFMLAAAAALVASGRGASIIAAVGAAAAVIVVLDPWAPLTVGFWLSFGAVLAIVWVCAGTRFGQHPVSRFLSAAVRTQWAATVALLPLGAAFFASVSLVSPLANAVAIPLVSAVITPLSLAGGAAALVWPQAAAVLIVPAAWLLQWLLVALEWLSAQPAAALAVPRPSGWILAVSLAGCVLLLAPAGVPLRALGALALLPLATVPVRRPAPGELWLTALDVGQGMAVVVQVADRVLLYDTGPRTGPHSDAGARVIVPWLRSQGIVRPHAVVVSHQDDDHSGGARSVLAAMPPDWFASSLPPGHPLLAGAPRPVRCERGSGWQWADARFDWLHPADPPEPARGSPSNAVSCVLRIRSPAGTALLPGDIGAAQERRLVALFGAQGLAADVLLAPHHGSITSSTDEFLDAVAPRWALFQQGYRNAFGHPHPRVLARYRLRGIEVLRSDAHGAVRLELRPGQPDRVVRSRESPARYWRVPVDPDAPVTARSSRRPSPRQRPAPGRPPPSTGTPPGRPVAPASRTLATAASRPATTSSPVPGSAPGRIRAHRSASAPAASVPSPGRSHCTSPRWWRSRAPPPWSGRRCRAWRPRRRSSVPRRPARAPRRC